MNTTVTGGVAAREFERHELALMGREQVKKNFEQIRTAIIDSYGGECPDATSTAIMRDIMSGNFQCWMIGGVVGEKRSMLGLATTRIILDPYLGRRFQIFTMTMYENLPSAILRQAMGRMEAFARDRQCTHIDCQTAHPGAEALAKQMGMEVVSVNMSKEIEYAAQ
jgi:hypothetical protein